jgi:hypothetical protein
LPQIELPKLEGNSLIGAASFVGTNGSHPQGGLVVGADGNYHGTTLEGRRERHRHGLQV